MERKCILGIFAHPDDEGGVSGSLRRYQDEGAMTVLICATRGEEGEISDPALATHESLGLVREQELREASRIIGVDDLTFLDYHDGRLADADPLEATGRIVRHIRRVRPQVVVTFDANGGYGHRDHIGIHNLTTAAFHQAGDSACYPEQMAEGLQPYAPQKLYYVAWPRSSWGRFRAQVQTADGQEFRPGGNAATIPFEEMGTPDDRITTTIPLDDYLFEVKQRAMQAHRTQMDPAGPFAHMTPEILRQIWGAEYFVRAVPPGAPGDGSEHDLFAGVALS